MALTTTFCSYMKPEETKITPLHWTPGARKKWLSLIVANVCRIASFAMIFPVVWSNWPSRSGFWVEERQSRDTRCALGEPKSGPSTKPKLTTVSCILTFVCDVNRFFIKFPTQTGHLYNIGSAEFILFCFELEVIQLLMNQLYMNIKFYFEQRHTVKQQCWKKEQKTVAVT